MYTLSSRQQLEQLVEDSHKHAQVLFKHSLECPASRLAFNELGPAMETYPYWYTLVLQQHPELASLVAETLGVEHKSPQVLVVRDGRVVFFANSYNIALSAVEKHLDTP